ncbi:MAG: CPBP family intramembrane metalloprotease [Fibrobacteres bacterium]|jgi:membrane protease YdiL (CAAX protease family)|nr:CPBP family intramembrane metalloprotease [Fibrobacterota bacterium]
MNAGDEGAAEAPIAEDVPIARPVLRVKRAVAIIAAFFLVQIFTGSCVAIGEVVYLVVFQGTSDRTLLANAIRRIMLPTAIVSEIASALVVLWMTRRFLTKPGNGGGMAAIGWRPARVSETSLAVLAGCLISLTYLFVLVRIHPPTAGQHWGPMVTAALAGGWSLHYWVILILACAPPIEEFLFRGILLEGLTNSFGIKVAAVIVTSAFVLLHASETLSYWPAWLGIALSAAMDLFFRLKTRSLIPAIGVHFGHNLVLVISAYTGIR